MELLLKLMKYNQSGPQIINIQQRNKSISKKIKLKMILMEISFNMKYIYHLKVLGHLKFIFEINLFK